MIKATLKDLLSFFKKPDDLQIELNIKGKLFFITILLLFELVITYTVIVPVLEQIDSVLDLKFVDITYFSFIESFLVMVLIVPFFEELIFRYFLRYQGVKTRIISQNQWKKAFPFIVYAFIICFGLLHTGNYTNTGNLFLALSPFIILSQLFGGLIITFIRVRLNFLWGVLYHWSWNFLFVIAVPLVEGSLTEPYTEQTANYTITIDEQTFFDEAKQSLKIDSTGGKIHSLHVQHYAIKHLLDTLYKKDNYLTDDVLISLDLSSKNGIDKDALIEILQKEYNIE